MSKSDNDSTGCNLGCLGCVTSLIGLVALVWIISHWHLFVTGVYFWMDKIFVR